MHDAYPQANADRDRWILRRRGSRPPPKVDELQGRFLETEPSGPGQTESVLTLLLTGRECPWRCVMCDLWRFTVPAPLPAGAVPAQIRAALDPVPAAHTLKLYNAGSFFDPLSVPPADYPAIAALVLPFRRVIVESHPALVGNRCLAFQQALGSAATLAGQSPPQLEVAMGLETAHPETLARLNKRMTLAQYRRAADFLTRHHLSLRSFLLVQPPFLPPADAVGWAGRSVAFAVECGARVVVLIPTRGGNGALEALATSGDFVAPSLTTLEAALVEGLGQAHGQACVFADLWDLARFTRCPACDPHRRLRLEQMNREQQPLPALPCPDCAGAADPTPAEGLPKPS